MRAPLFKRWVGSDGVEVRAVKEDPPRSVMGYPVTSAYPIYVAGALRGFLVYQEPGYGNRHSHRGWAIRSLKPSDPESPERGHQSVATTYSTAPGLGAALLSRVPDLIGDGLLPTKEEADAWTQATAEQRREERVRRAAEQAAYTERSARDRAEAAEAHSEMIAGLESLGNRDDLSNLERAAVIHALRRLRRS
jgi:hypothetical protein